MLEVANLTVSYRQRPAIHHINAQFPLHSMWAVFGPNGAGKSTLLKSLMRLLQPDTGKVLWQGLQRQDLAYLPQRSEIDRSQPISVFELAAMGLWYEIGFFKRLNAAQKVRVMAALARVEMVDFAARPISQLSNGQFQRVLFARMLVQKAKYFLLDEPFNAVDARTTYALLEVLRQAHAEERISIVAVLHDYEQVRAYFPNTLLIAREKIAAGTTKEVLTEPFLQQANEVLSQHSDDWCAPEDEGRS